MRLQNDRNRNHRIGEARSENGHEDERQKDRRESEQHIHGSHDHAVDPAAEIAGEHTEDCADDQ